MTPAVDPTPAAGDAVPERASGPVAVPDRTRSDVVTAAVDAWAAALRERAGESPLADVDRLGDARVDLSAAHPGGLAPLFAGRPTRLSNLVREGAALAAARRRARTVTDQALDLAERHGLSSAHLAIGVATWTETLPAVAAEKVEGPDPDPAGDPTDTVVTAPPVGRRTLRAPVLLRPVELTARGDHEHEFTLQPSLEVNPLLAAALRRAGALLDPAALARGAFTEAGFDPHPAVERLRALGGAVLTDFAIDERLLVGCFVHPEQAMIDDLEALAPGLVENEVALALMGDEDCVAALAHPLPEPRPGDRSTDLERGVGDLDPAQTYLLDVVAAGHHVLMDTAPGTDAAGTVAAVVADAVASGRSVLYVAGHRRAAAAVTERLADLGLAETVLDVGPDPAWRTRSGRSLLAAMTVEPLPVDAERVNIVRRELTRRRDRLTAYQDALHRVREPWGCSAYDALQQLARLTSVRPTPHTTVRLPVHVAAALIPERRAQAAADLVHVATLGAFTSSPSSSAWWGADLVTAEQARTALRRARLLLDHALPTAAERITQVAIATGLTPATSPARWAEQLEMLAGVRGALDEFQPLVFERSVADLVAATATPEWRRERGIEIPGAVRRRLVKQAKDLVRPGRPVADLHAALVRVREQQEIWQAHCPAGGWPRVPEGLAAIAREATALVTDLGALADVLATTPLGRRGPRLTELGWDELRTRLTRLTGDGAALDTLPERTAVVRNLEKQGLGTLLTDLAERRVSAGLVGAELDLAWWSTAFEAMVAEDPAIAAHDGPALTRLVAEFRALDERFGQDNATLARAAHRDLLRGRLRHAEEQSQALFAEVVEGRFTSLRAAVERYPGVTRALRPCLVTSPLLVPHTLPPTRTEDLVVLDEIGHLPLDLVLPALARGRQVLVVADTAASTGSAVARLAEVLPTVPLPAAVARRDPRLTRFLAAHGYADRLTDLPLPTVRDLLRLDVVDGTGMPSADGVVEATAAEVAHTVELVVTHALTRPEESLAVLTASETHAERVRAAVADQVRESPALAQFFRSDRPEPFTVTTIGRTEGLSREAVILSLGFGRTPHGRVLHRFGAVTEPGGGAALLEALGVPRRRLAVVSCFTSADLDPDRLRSPGAFLLLELLSMLAGRGATPADLSATGPVPRTPNPDRLLLDLAERLFRAGLLVEVDHGDGDAHLPLVVGHPDVPGEFLVAVLTDDDGYLAEPSLRVRDRQTPRRLEALGWSVVQVWSAAVFLDPQGEADAIRDVVLEAVARRTAARREPVVVPTLEAEPEAEAAQAPDAGNPAPVEPALVAVAAAPVRPAIERAVAVEEVLFALADAGVTGPGRGPRPAVERNLKINAYSDDQLDELVAWIQADGEIRDDAELGAALRAELGLTRRGARIDAAIAGAVRRAR